MMEEKTDTIAKKTPEATVSSTRPTKKQKELLNFIEEFINVRGYSPSYREIMKGMQYTSVATVSLHVNSLIKRGHLQKRDRSARSLEVVKPTAAQAKVVPKQLRTSEAKWLVDKVEQFFKDVEQSPKLIEQEIDQLYVLIGALKVLGIEGASQAFIPRLTQIKKRKENSEYVV
jgi:SOS-response transcriptional repressor LexA